MKDEMIVFTIKDLKKRIPEIRIKVRRHTMMLNNETIR